MEERKCDTLLGYSGRIALRREQCGVFTPCKDCNIETRSRDYAAVDEAVFSPCRAEPSCDELHIASPRLASHLLSGNSYEHLDDARVARGHVTASAVKQQLKRFPCVRSRVYRTRLRVSSRKVLSWRRSDRVN
jgi:hypothetical protein